MIRQRLILIILGFCFLLPLKAQAENTSGVLNELSDRLNRNLIGEVVLVQFMRCDAQTCQDSLRALNSFVIESLPEEGYTIIAVAAADDASDVSKLTQNLDLSFSVLPDEEMELTEMSGAKRLPYTLIYNTDGEIAYSHEGFSQGREAEFSYVVDTLIKGDPLRWYLRHRPEKPGGEAQLPQQSNLMAKSVLGEKAPEVPIEKWITEKPETTEGKYILYDFWATWCGPCIYGLQLAEKEHRRFKDKLATIAVSDESEDTVRSFLESTPLKQPIAIDTQGRASKALQIRAIPHGILIDPEGMVIWQGNPIELWSDTSKLEALLN